MKWPLYGKKALLYLLTGALFSVEVFFIMLTQRSTEQTERHIEALRESSYKVEAMKQSMKEMRALLKGARLGKDVSRETAELILLAAVDRVKARLGATEIKVSDFREAYRALSLEMEVEARVMDYSSFARNMNYLESMIRPWFRIKALVVSRDDEGYKYRLPGPASMAGGGDTGGGGG
jgi:hypothetical protein